MSMGMNAYVTLLSSEQYLDGVIILNQSLRFVKSEYPLFCALSENISVQVANFLNGVGIRTVRLKQSLIVESLQNTSTFRHWNYTFDKLLIWGLKEFDKIVFVDADMLVLRNIDSLFHVPAFSAVCAGKSFHGNEKWNELNSGLMVIEPNIDVEAELIRKLDEVLQDRGSLINGIGDQDIIHRYMPKWPDYPELHLDEGYNVFADFLTYYILRLHYSFKKDSPKPIYVVHFIGKLKPWMKTSFRNKLWLASMFIRNPYYFIPYFRCKTLLKKAMSFKI